MSDRVTYAMENDVLRVELDPIVPKKYLKAAGMTGSGLAPTRVNIAPSVRGGGRWQSTVRLPRDLDLPVTIFGAGRQEIEDNLRQLVAVFQDRFTTPMLVATYPNGDQFETEFHYAGGADHQWGSSDTNGRDFVKWPLKVTCPSPYWVSRQPTTFEIKGASGRGLLRPGGSLTQLRVTSSQAMGQVTITNDGDVDAYPVWTLRGPGTGFTTTRLVDGASLIYNSSIAAGQNVIIDTQRATIEDQNGTNLFGGLVGAPKFFTIPPGTNQISAAMLGVTTQSLVVMSFRPRREMIF